MASFGWKRKIGEKVSKVTSQQFEEEAADVVKKEDIDWIHATKRKKEVLLEDNITKSKRLREEGIALAQNARHLEAIKVWDSAIHLTPEDASLYEMKSQDFHTTVMCLAAGAARELRTSCLIVALMCLDEKFHAVQTAETAVQRDPHFVEAWQTLGRAQLGLGEITMAIRSFQVGLHLCPTNSELREEDLTWALRLFQQKKGAVKTEERKKDCRGINEELEIIPDYDFESDEVVAACAAISQRQVASANNTGIVVSASGLVTNAEQKKNDSSDSNTEMFIKAR
uniref:Tetratricopeptide repeat domain 33 n=1 Tax=Leptobrachium leishanense TaxID=445787 RepID=A0A8C5LQL9_9ANUR